MAFGEVRYAERFAARSSAALACASVYAQRFSSDETLDASGTPPQVDSSRVASGLALLAVSLSIRRN
jgi:hypothetical protein